MYVQKKLYLANVELSSARAYRKVNAYKKVHNERKVHTYILESSRLGTGKVKIKYNVLLGQVKLDSGW
jgi:hypothetical protein